MIKKIINKLSGNKIFKISPQRQAIYDKLPKLIQEQIELHKDYTIFTVNNKKIKILSRLATEKDLGINANNPEDHPNNLSTQKFLTLKDKLGILNVDYFKGSDIKDEDILMDDMYQILGLFSGSAPDFLIAIGVVEVDSNGIKQGYLYSGNQSHNLDKVWGEYFVSGILWLPISNLHIRNCLSFSIGGGSFDRYEIQDSFPALVITSKEIKVKINLNNFDSKVDGNNDDINQIGDTQNTVINEFQKDNLSECELLLATIGKSDNQRQAIYDKLPKLIQEQIELHKDYTIFTVNNKKIKILSRLATEKDLGINANNPEDHPNEDSVINFIKKRKSEGYGTYDYFLGKDIPNTGVSYTEIVAIKDMFYESTDYDINGELMEDWDNELDDDSALLRFQILIGIIELNHNGCIKDKYYRPGFESIGSRYYYEIDTPLGAFYITTNEKTFIISRNSSGYNISSTKINGYESDTYVKYYYFPVLVVRYC